MRSKYKCFLVIVWSEQLSFNQNKIFCSTNKINGAIFDKNERNREKSDLAGNK